MATPASLEQRLRRLRQRARRSARTATVLASTGAAALLLIVTVSVALPLSLLLGLGPMLPQAQPLPAAIDPLVRILLIAMLPLWLAGALRMLLQIWVVPRLHAFHYRESLAWMHWNDEAQLYVHEEFAQILEADRQQAMGWRTVYAPAEQARTLEHQLEYLSFHGELLRYSATLEPLRDRREFQWARQGLRAQGFFNQPLGLWLTCTAFGLTGLWFMFAGILSGIQTFPAWAEPLIPFAMLAWGLPVVFGFQYGPRFIIARARLVALLDFLLEEPRAALDCLERPAERRHWLARQTAPWRFRGATPD